MGRRIDLTGQKFGRLTVVGYAGPCSRGKAMWRCRCDCGNERAINSQNLRRGASRSCGCLNAEVLVARSTTHGESKRTPEYNAWAAARARCSGCKRRGSHLYGGRGIRVCERWESYGNFLLDMGRKPSPQHSLDRIDSNGNYEPGNCRWATPAEQSRNTSRVRKLTHSGETKTIAEWARELGVCSMTLIRRLDEMGWSAEKALTTPARKGGRKKTIIGTAEGWRIRFCGV